VDTATSADAGGVDPTEEGVLMTETSASRPTGTSVPKQSARSAGQPSGWVGWIVFAGTMMIIIGSLHAVQGLVAVFNDEYFLVTKNGLTVHLDYTAWGWTHIIAGLVVIGAGLGLFAGQMWARVVGIILASLSLLLNFAFIASYPFWSAIVIAMDVFVIMALTVHGREMKQL
jgi:hypothetical protein